ncbi:MAG: glucosaminidase domain-containing protein [Chloroflexi bacterium]|nr:glucosaminidase domain-containing protein [Chloroflexota bacterium]
MRRIWRERFAGLQERVRVLARPGAHGYAAITAVAIVAASLPGLDRSGLFAASDTVPTAPVVEVAAAPQSHQLNLPAQSSGPAVADAQAQPAAVEPQPAGAADRVTPSSRGGDRPPQSTPAAAAPQSQPTLPAEQNPAPAQQSAPAAQPTVKAAAPAADAKATPTTPQEKFIASLAGDARQSQRESGVPASVTLAQAMLESDTGRSQLSQLAKNYFGIKATNGPGPAGVVTMDTWEVIKGANVTVSAAFRAYNTAAESFADHGRYLRDNSVYAEAMEHTEDAQLFAKLIHKAGYATDPQYANKLIALMDRYNLYAYDLK